jgi:hypothetical protein
LREERHRERKTFLKEAGFGDVLALASQSDMDIMLGA